MKNNKKRTAPPQKTAEKRSVEGSAVGSKRYHTLGDLLQNPAVVEPRKAIIPRLMWQGARTVLASREKLGKSTLVAKGVAAASKGGSFLGEHCEEASLIWVNLEEPVPEMVQRFHGFDGHHNRIIIINYLEPDWTKHIAEIAVETGAVGVVIDSYAMLLAHCGVTKENDSGLANAKIIAPLTRLTRKTGLGVTLIAHSRKSDGTYRGATALGAGVDQLIEMFPSNTSKNHRKFSTKGRWYLEDFEVSFDGKGYELTQGELPLETRIVSLIQAWPNSTVRRIRDAVGGKHETVQTALRKLEGEGTIHDYGNAQKSAYRMTEDQTEPDMGTSNGSPESSLETRTEPLEGTTAVPFSQPKGLDSGTTREEVDDVDASDAMPTRYGPLQEVTDERH